MSHAARTAEPELLFYDGGCGLCHRAVRFVLWVDASGRAFRFAPLGGATFERLITPDDRSALPDSLVVRTSDGRLLTRSTGVLYALSRLGPGWHILAILMGFVPRPIRDVAYDFVARIRFRLLAKPDDTCPVVPPLLRGRFLP